MLALDSAVCCQSVGAPITAQYCQVGRCVTSMAAAALPDRFARMDARVRRAARPRSPACNFLTTEDDPRRPPDVFDKVRAIDLLPRFPQQTATAADRPRGRRAARDLSRHAAIRRRRSSLAGVVGAQPAPNGEGFELNFENTPVTGVVKVVLGDILGLGYLIDPRVQGTVTLASGRPVPKDDLLFVLESALRLSGAALVRDKRGYIVLPSPTRSAAAASTSRARAEPGFGITVVPLQYVSAATLTKLLDSFAAEARHGARRSAAQSRAGAGQRRRPAQRGRDRAELRRGLDARAVGRHLSGAQQRARADHQRARAHHGFGRGRPEPEPRQAAADRAAQRHHGDHQQAQPAAHRRDVDHPARQVRHRRPA